MAHLKLGEMLVHANLINEGQLKAALVERQKWGGRLGEILVRMNLVKEEALVQTLSSQLAIAVANVDAIRAIPEHVRAKVPAARAKELRALPLQLRDEGKTLVVAMAEPQNLTHLDALRAMTRCKIVSQLAGKGALERALARVYEGSEISDSDDQGSFNVLDAQGRTVTGELQIGQAQQFAAAARATTVPPVPPRSTTAAPVPPAGPADPLELLRTLEGLHRQGAAALEAMVDLLIEKGVFSRAEFSSKMKR